MRKRYKFIFIVFSSLLITIIIFSYRYPFLNPSVGNWSVGFHNTTQIFNGDKIVPEGIITYEYINSIVPEDIDYIADPFFISTNDSIYLFVEIKGRGNANIALLTSADGKNYSYTGIVLDEEFHLSYPQVFKENNDFYMLPEAKGSGHVLLYKATSFPFDWKIVDTLLKNVEIKDPSILLSEEINLIVGVDDNLRQYIFSSDSLRGTWKELEDYKQNWGNETRPGGRFFEINDNWYLPVQNSRFGYGSGISLHRLEVKNKTVSIEPEHEMFLGPQEHIPWFNRGMHHLDIQKMGDGYFLVYDGDRNTSNAKEFQYRRTLKMNLIDIYNFFR